MWMLSYFLEYYSCICAVMGLFLDSNLLASVEGTA